MRAFDFAFGQRSKSSSLRSRPHPALRATFSRFAGEGLIPNLAARDGEEALLPFTGEGARRACPRESGGRRRGRERSGSVRLMLSGRAGAARFARALIRRFAPPSPASQAKGWVRTQRQKPDGEALLPLAGEGARRADEGARAQRSVLLMLPGRAGAARSARALIRRYAPPSP